MSEGNEHSKFPEIRDRDYAPKIPGMLLENASDVERWLIESQNVMEQRIDNLEAQMRQRNANERDLDIRLQVVERMSKLLSSYWAVMVGLVVGIPSVYKLVEIFGKLVK